MKRLGLFAAYSLVIAVCGGPIFWQLITSFKMEQDLSTLPPILPPEPTADHYREVIFSTTFLRSVANSVVVSAAAAFLSLVIGSLAAFALARLPLRGKRVILAFVLSSSMFPAVATISPLYLIVRALMLRDSLTALIVLYTAFSLPLSIWVLTGFFRAVPEEMYRASLIDGCTPFQSFRRIILPLSAPGIGACAILIFLFAWNEFLFALTFTVTDHSRTIPVAVATFPGIHEIPWGEISAASILAIIPAVAFVFIFQRKMIEGLTSGGVKG